MLRAVIRALALTAFLAIGAYPAQAGQLFPPSNAAGNSNTCPANTVLAWSVTGDGGHVECVSPHPIQGTLCGMVFWETRDNGYFGNVQTFSKCNGTAIMDVLGAKTCPIGYSFVSAAYNWGSTNGYNYTYHQGTCAAD